MNAIESLLDPDLPSCHTAVDLFNASIPSQSDFRYYLSAHVTLTVIIIGLGLNMLAIGALRTHVDPRPVICSYLIALALWNSALLATAAVMTALPNSIYGDEIRARPFLPWYPLILCSSTVTVVGNVWTLVMLAVERYSALKYPFSQLSRRPLNLAWIMVITAGFGVAYSWPRLFELKVIDCLDSHQHSQLELVPTRLRQSVIYGIAHRLIGGMLLCTTLPYAVVLVLTIGIGKVLTRKQLGPTQRTGGRPVMEMLDASNKMLLMVNAKYLLTTFPTTIIDILELITPASVFMNDNLIANLVSMSNLLITLNSATNFCVYYWCSPFFRKAVNRFTRGHFGREKYTLRAAGYQIRMLATCQAQGMIAYHHRTPQLDPLPEHSDQVYHNTAALRDSRLSVFSNLQRTFTLGSRGSANSIQISNRHATIIDLRPAEVHRSEVKPSHSFSIVTVDHSKCEHTRKEQIVTLCDHAKTTVSKL